MLGCIFLFQEYPFLGPCFSFLPRIPQDSCEFLFFPEEFFHRNLLLAGVRKFRFLAKLTGILHSSCIFLHLTLIPANSSGILRIPPEFLFPPKLSGDKLGSSACIAAMGCYDLAPPPLDTHSTPILDIFKVFYILYMWLVSIWMQLNSP